MEPALVSKNSKDSKDSKDKDPECQSPCTPMSRVKYPHGRRNKQKDGSLRHRALWATGYTRSAAPSVQEAKAGLYKAQRHFRTRSWTDMATHCVRDGDAPVSGDGGASERPRAVSAAAAAPVPGQGPGSDPEDPEDPLLCLEVLSGRKRARTDSGDSSLADASLPVSAALRHTSPRSPVKARHAVAPADSCPSPLQLDAERTGGSLTSAPSPPCPAPSRPPSLSLSELEAQWHHEAAVRPYSGEFREFLLSRAEHARESVLEKLDPGFSGWRMSVVVWMMDVSCGLQSSLEAFFSAVLLLDRVSVQRGEAMKHYEHETSLFRACHFLACKYTDITFPSTGSYSKASWQCDAVADQEWLLLALAADTLPSPTFWTFSLMALDTLCPFSAPERKTGDMREVYSTAGMLAFLALTQTRFVRQYPAQVVGSVVARLALWACHRSVFPQEACLLGMEEVRGVVKRQAAQDILGYTTRLEKVPAVKQTAGRFAANRLLTPRGFDVVETVKALGEQDDAPEILFDE